MLGHDPNPCPKYPPADVDDDDDDGGGLLKTCDVDKFFIKLFRDCSLIRFKSVNSFDTSFSVMSNEKNLG